MSPMLKLAGESAVQGKDVALASVDKILAAFAGDAVAEIELSPEEQDRLDRLRGLVLNPTKAIRELRRRAW